MQHVTGNSYERAIDAADIHCKILSIRGEKFKKLVVLGSAYCSIVIIPYAKIIVIVVRSAVSVGQLPASSSTYDINPVPLYVSYVARVPRTDDQIPFCEFCEV